VPEFEWEGKAYLVVPELVGCSGCYFAPIIGACPDDTVLDCGSIEVIAIEVGAEDRYTALRAAYRMGVEPNEDE